MHRLAFLMLALVLVGCESQTERLTALDSEDDAICRKSVSAGSAASYNQCRTNLIKYRALEAEKGRRVLEAYTAVSQSMRPIGLTCTTGMTCN
jgi:hypothetical protein